MYELPEDGTDVSKHVGILKDHALMCICKYCFDLVVNITEVFIVVARGLISLKITVFWEMTPCSLVRVYSRLLMPPSG